MKPMIAVAGLLVTSGAMFGQEEKVLTAREVAESMIKDLNGWKEHYQVMPGWFPAQPSAPATFWTTAPLPAPKPGVETVSVASLQHSVPKAAKKAFDRSADLLTKGDFRGAAEELEKAVALDPDYADAHSDLGFAYLKLGRTQEAETEFRRALEVDPYLSVAHSNLGWALFGRRAFPEAERSARRALALSLNNDSAHVLLGILLGSAPATRAEGVRHIEQAANRFPELAPLLAELRGR